MLYPPLQPPQDPSAFLMILSSDHVLESAFHQVIIIQFAETGLQNYDYRQWVFSKIQACYLLRLCIQRPPLKIIVWKLIEDQKYYVAHYSSQRYSIAKCSNHQFFKFTTASWFYDLALVQSINLRFYQSIREWTAFQFYELSFVNMRNPLIFKFTACMTII